MEISVASAMNSALRLAFLRSVEGLAFFFVPWVFTVTALLLVSREKVKSGPMETEKLKTWPWLVSAWHKARHFARESSPPAGVLIVVV